MIHIHTCIYIYIYIYTYIYIYIHVYNHFERLDQVHQGCGIMLNVNTCYTYYTS